jgi:hypothetical protein
MKAMAEIIMIFEMFAAEIVNNAAGSQEVHQQSCTNTAASTRLHMLPYLVRGTSLQHYEHL